MSKCPTSLSGPSIVEHDPVFLSQKAKPGGVATLDANGKVPLSQIDISAIFTERDPVYRADRGVAFGCATLNGSARVLSEQLGSGTADSTTFLRGDGVWAVPTGGGGGSGDIKSNGTVPFAADESMGGHKLTNVQDPTSPQDAATKAYVDSYSGWQRIGAVISEVTLTDKVVIGGTSPLGKLSVIGDTAGDITAVIKAAAAQTADLLRLLDSSGTQLFAIGTTVFIDMADGSLAPISSANHGRQRYNNTSGNKGFEVSVDGGPWERVIADEREVERIASMLDL